MAGVIHSIGCFTGHGGGYCIVVLTQDNPTMAYGVATIESIARAINRDLESLTSGLAAARRYRRDWEGVVGWKPSAAMECCVHSTLAGSPETCDLLPGCVASRIAAARPSRTARTSSTTTSTPANLLCDGKRHHRRDRHQPAHPGRRPRLRPGYPAVLLLRPRRDPRTAARPTAGPGRITGGRRLPRAHEVLRQVDWRCATTRRPSPPSATCAWPGPSSPTSSRGRGGDHPVPSRAGRHALIRRRDR